jgi:hypothetical protein
MASGKPVNRVAAVVVVAIWLLLALAMVLRVLCMGGARGRSEDPAPTSQ